MTNQSNTTDSTALNVRFDIIEEGVWRACLVEAEHIGGSGTTPEQALGFLCFNHPQRMGIINFSWINPPPELPSHPVEIYPAGYQKPFEK